MNRIKLPQFLLWIKYKRYFKDKNIGYKKNLLQLSFFPNLL